MTEIESQLIAFARATLGRLQDEHFDLEDEEWLWDRAKELGLAYEKIHNPEEDGFIPYADEGDIIYKMKDELLKQEWRRHV